MRRSVPLRLPTSSRVPPPPINPNAGSTSYGPFSATAKARLARERHQQGQPPCQTSSPSRSLDVMQSIGLGTNRSLRLALAALPHPSQLQSMTYQSPEWRQAMVRLYRLILRLHNKTVAVSVDRSRRAGSADAVAAVTGVASRVRSAEDSFLQRGGRSGSDDVACPEDSEPQSEEDYLLRYLLTPEQREFGNRFVQGEFMRSRDADARSAVVFYESWYQYVLQLASGVTARDLSEEEKKMLTPEQKEKLKEMRGAFTSLRAQNEPGYML